MGPILTIIVKSLSHVGRYVVEGGFKLEMTRFKAMLVGYVQAVGRYLLPRLLLKTCYQCIQFVNLEPMS